MGIAVHMKVTRASVETYARDKGYEPVQIDGIPEGFAFKAPDVSIGGKNHVGAYVAFVPLKDWEDEFHKLTRPDEKSLIKAFNSVKK